MSIESDLRKDGIEVIKKLDTLRVNSIARTVSISLCETFPDFNLNQNDLFIKLSRLDMYIAKMPEGMSEANYFYKNSSIYFNEHIDDDDLEALYASNGEEHIEIEETLNEEELEQMFRQVENEFK